jgi:hypothetical protein
LLKGEEELVKYESNEWVDAEDYGKYAAGETADQEEVGVERDGNDVDDEMTQNALAQVTLAVS